MKTNLILSAALSLCLCAASTAQTLPAYLPTDGLVGWWPFNGNANDESGNGNDGTVNGATLTEDRFGVANAAYNFDGVDDWIDVLNNQGLNSASGTVSAWLKSNGELFNDQQLIFGQYQSRPQLIVNTNNNQKASISWPSSNGDNANATSTSLISSGEWISVIGTYSSNNIKIYINGVFEAELITELTQSNCFSSIYNIGGFNATNQTCGGEIGQSQFFNGNIDDIAIYNRALSPEEITALYTGEPVNPPAACNPLPSNLQNGLVGYWPFCGNANDESGNGNDGTVNGATLTEDRFGVANAAYAFDGNGNYISIADNDDLLLENTDFSISSWILPLSESNGHIFYKGFSSGNSSKYIFAMYNQSIGFHVNPPFNINYWIHSDSIPLGIWQLATITKQGNLVSFFRNGEIYGQQTLNYPIPNTSGVEARIGGAEPNGGGWWNGRLDDIGIWNRALTPAEVQQLYTLNACTFTIYDTTNVTIYDTVSVSLSTTDTLIINTLITAVEPAQENTFLVYPNPASTQITINNGNVAILGGYTMRISNSLGQDVYNQNITQPQVTLDLSTWGGNGLYVLYIVDPQQNIVAVKQIVLQ